MLILNLVETLCEEGGGERGPDAKFLETRLPLGSAPFLCMLNRRQIVDAAFGFESSQTSCATILKDTGPPFRWTRNTEQK